MEDTQGTADAENETDESLIADNLGRSLMSTFDTWKQERRNTEEKWVSNLRAKNSIYEPQEMALIKEKGENACDKYVGVTRFKCVAAIAKLYSLLFPGPKKKNWSIAPTPVPNIENIDINALVSTMSPSDREALGAVDGFEKEKIKEFKKSVSVLARKKADEMSKAIDDQLVEAKYDVIMRRMLTEFVVLGTGCIKGATVDIKISKGWGYSAEAGGYEVVLNEKIVPGIDGPSVWDLYPDPWATEIESASGIFQRHCLSKHQLRTLKEYEGFDSEKIEDLIDTAPDGNYTQESWEIDIKSMTESSNTSQDVVGKYEVVQYWGIADGSELQEVGVDIQEDELDMEFQANVWVSGGITIRAELTPIEQDRLPYFFACYENETKIIWGTGVPDKIRETQSLLNATVRILIDNLSISSGPQIEVDIGVLDQSQLADVRNRKFLNPYQVWLRDSSGGDSSSPLLRFYYPKSIAGDLLKVLETLRRIIDEESNIPAITQGESVWKGSNMTDTAAGMNMMLGEARTVSVGNIRNIDDGIIKPLVESLYDFNMRYSDDDGIKGDMKITALGTASYMAREVQSRNLLNFLNLTNNDVDRPLTKRDKLLKSVAEALDIDEENLLNEDEIKALKENPQKTAMFQLETEKAKKELEKMIAEIEKLKSEVAENYAQAERHRGEQKGRTLSAEGKESEKKGGSVDVNLMNAEKQAQIGLANQKIQTEKENRVQAAETHERQKKKEDFELVNSIEGGGSDA